MISFPVFLLRLVLALVLGALVGLERESSEHTAGMRTNALVSLGSALFTIISAYGFASLLGTLHIQVDPTRIACGVGLLVEAVTVTILALLVLVFLHLLERHLLLPRLKHIQHLSIETTATASSLLDQVYDICVRSGITVGALKIRTDQEVHTIEVACHITNATALPHIIGELHQLPGVRAVYADMPDIE